MTEGATGKHANKNSSTGKAGALLLTANDLRCARGAPGATAETHEATSSSAKAMPVPHYLSKPRKAQFDVHAQLPPPNPTSACTCWWQSRSMMTSFFLNDVLLGLRTRQGRILSAVCDGLIARRCCGMGVSQGPLDRL